MKTLIGTCVRLWNMVSIVVKHGFRHALESLLGGRFKWLRRTSAPVKLRLALEELGPTFIKFGQFMATRADFFPEYCSELYKLLDRVPPFPHREAREVIRRELGDYPEILFPSFPSYPVASASLAQVYAAVLPEGEKVAVKVQRPGIPKIIEQDLRIFLFLTRIMDVLKVMGPLKATPYVREFAATIRDELDFEMEAFNAQRLYEHAVHSPTEKIPKVYRAYTTDKVLTTEYLEGIWLSELIQTLNSNDADRIRRLHEQGINRVAVAKNIYRNSMTQLHERGFFHVDLHPANIVVMENNCIGYVDFGVVGSVDEEFRINMLRYLECASKGDVEAASDLFLRLSVPQKGADVEGFKRDYRADLIRYHNAMHSPRSSLRAKSMGTYLTRHMLSARKHHIAFPTRTLTFSRALITLDIIVLQLAPEMDMVGQLAQFIEEARARALLRGISLLFDGERLCTYLVGFLEQLPKVSDAVLDRWNRSLGNTEGRFTSTYSTGQDGIHQDSGPPSRTRGIEPPEFGREGHRWGGLTVVSLMALCWAVLLSALGEGDILRTPPFREIIVVGFILLTFWMLISSRRLR